MTTFQKHCDVYQGYAFEQDVQTTVGYLTALTIGDTVLAADQTVTDPTAPSTSRRVVAVLSGAMWELGVTDAIHVAGHVSIVNQQAIALFTMGLRTDVSVTCELVVCEYDPIAKAYFPCLRAASEAPLKGLLEKNGDDLNLSVADDPSTEVQTPENYAFQIGIKPRPQAQSVTVATSSTSTIVKRWGITVEA